jgi:hypothetical protein
MRRKAMHGEVCMAVSESPQAPLLDSASIQIAAKLR